MVGGKAVGDVDADGVGVLGAVAGEGIGRMPHPGDVDVGVNTGAAGIGGRSVASSA